MRRVFAYALLTALAFGAPAVAQEQALEQAQEQDDPGGPLVRLLENTLSNDNRTIKVTGMDGALSSRATIERIEVSDTDGVWLRLDGAVLDWNRVALVRGRFSVNELTADRIELLRKPLPTPSEDLPTPEAHPFQMPDLPVAIEIGKLAVGHVALAQGLTGVAATLSLDGRLSLADGALDTNLAIDRLDRPGDHIALIASFANDTRQIGLDIRATEEAGGLISSLLNLPGAPPVTLSVQGTGPVSDFAADLRLATDNVDRVTGRVELTGDDTQAVAFTGHVTGDVRPLLADDFDAFFGPDTRVDLQGRRAQDGQLDISHLTVRAEALSLDAALSLTATAQPARARLDLTMAHADGTDVILPVPGGATRLRRLTAQGRFDAQAGQGWTLTANLDGFSQPQVTLGTARITAEGQYDSTASAPLTGQVNATLAQLGLADPDLVKAAGSDLSLTGDFSLTGARQLTLSGVDLRGTDYRARVDAALSGLSTGFEIDGTAALTLTNLARFDGLAGQPIQGQLSAELSGKGAPLGGTFDVTLAGTGTDLRLGQDMVDPLLTGKTELHLEATRGPDGVTLRDLTLTGTALQAQAQGNLQSGAADLTLNAALDDLGRILPDLPGPVQVTGQARQRHDSWTADLDVTAPRGAQAAITATVPNDLGDALAFDMSVTEPAGGPIGALLNLPDNPALALTAKGGGAITDFSADVTLATDAIDRLTGRVTLTEQAQADQTQGTAFHAQLHGDATPLLPPDYRAFFGTDAQLNLTGLRHGDGRLDLTDLRVETGAMDLTGAARLSAGMRPLQADLTATLASAVGTGPVRLPIPGDPVTLRHARIAATLDGETGDSWSLTSTVEGLSHPLADLARLTLRGSGAVHMGEGLTASGQLRAGLLGLAMTDPSLRSAIGSSLTFDGAFDLPGDDTLALRDLSLRGPALEASASLFLSELASTRNFTSTADLRLPDLAPLSGLAHRPLRGSAGAALEATGTLAPRHIDLRLTSLLQDVTTGIAQADALLAGDTHLRLDAVTRADGADLRSLTLTNAALRATAHGFASPTTPDLSATITLDDLARVLPAFPGETTLTAALSRTDGPYIASLNIAAPNDSHVSARASHDPDGISDIRFDGQMHRLERFIPQFPGSLSAQGTARREAGAWQFDAKADGPADIRAALSGLFDEATGTLDATAKGNLQLAAANAFVSPISVQGSGGFDLALRGKPALDAVSGQITLSNTSIAIPQIQNTVRNFGGTVSLDQGRASVGLRGDLRTGGNFTISGPVDLSAPYNGNIAMALNQLILTDEVVYRAPVSGQLSFAGPLAGNATLSGRIDVGETDIDIGNIGGSSSAAPIPPLTHVGEPGPVHATRARAGLTGNGNGSASSAAIGLDLLISAPNRIFVRGRGLNAELGGEILIRGTTANIAPSGQIELIRGIMGLFGRRLELSKGLISLQGTLKPFLEFAATSSTNAGSASLEMAGELDNLNVTISSDPELPEEEALALLIFGNEYSNLSPFKIAQLAAGLLALRGGGDFVGETGRNATGADSVSIANDSGGLPSLGLGGYLSDNVYTDVAVNADGDTELHLNLDVTDNLTLKGSVDNSGESGIGIFFDRDY